MTLSIDAISCGHRLDSDAKKAMCTRLDQNVSHVLKPPLSPISSLVPMPMVEQVFVYRFVVYQDVLRELGRIVVQKVTERFDDLSDNGCETGVVFR